MITFKQSLANWLEYPNNTEYIIYFAFIIAIDAISSISLPSAMSGNMKKRVIAIF